MRDFGQNVQNSAILSTVYLQQTQRNDSGNALSMRNETLCDFIAPTVISRYATKVTFKCISMQIKTRLFNPSECNVYIALRVASPRRSHSTKQIFVIYWFVLPRCFYCEGSKVGSAFREAFQIFFKGCNECKLWPFRFVTFMGSIEV